MIFKAGIEIVIKGAEALCWNGKYGSLILLAYFEYVIELATLLQVAIFELGVAFAKMAQRADICPSFYRYSHSST